MHCAVMISHIPLGLTCGMTVVEKARFFKILVHAVVELSRYAAVFFITLVLCKDALTPER
jgi:hypothetical protein